MACTFRVFNFIVLRASPLLQHPPAVPEAEVETADVVVTIHASVIVVVVVVTTTMSMTGIVAGIREIESAVEDVMMTRTTKAMTGKMTTTKSATVMVIVIATVMMIATATAMTTAKETPAVTMIEIGMMITKRAKETMIQKKVTRMNPGKRMSENISHWVS